MKWIVEPFAFTKFDGDGLPVDRSLRALNWPADPEPAKVDAKVVETEFGAE